MDENGQMNKQVEENNIIPPQPNVQMKKKNCLIWVIPVIIVIVGIALVAGYWYLSKPEMFYQRFVGNMIESVTKQETKEIKDYESIRSAIKLDLDVDLEEDLEEELENLGILELINGIELELDAKINKKDKKLVLDVDTEYNNEDLLDLKLFANAEDKEAYIYAKEILDKYLEVDIDSEAFEFLEEADEVEMLTLGEKINLKKGNAIIKKELAKTIKAEYCSAEKLTQNISGKDVKVTKNTIKMTLEQLGNELAAVYGNLKHNEDLLDTIEDEYRNDMIELLEKNEESSKEIAENEGSDKNAIKINTYTTGLNQDIIKVEMVILEENEEVAIISVTKEDEQKYSFKLLTEEKEDLIKGEIALENVSEKGATVNLETEIEGLGNFEIKLGIETEYDVQIETVDKEKVTSLNELTESEIIGAMEKLQKSKLYEVLEKLSSNSSNLGNSTNDNDFDGLDSTIDDYNTSLPGNNFNTTLAQNQICDYDKEFKITFGVPNGYETDRISDSYTSLAKDDIDITITTEYFNEDEYYDKLVDTKEYFEKQSDYKNVTLSETETTTIAGKTFYKATFAYETSYGYNGDKDYIWTKLSNDKVLTFEIYNLDKMTRVELEKILTINVEK